MYRVYRTESGCCFLFVTLFLHFSFFPTLKHFSQELWGLEDWNLVHTWTVGRRMVYTGIRLLLLIHPFISSVFFLSNFQTLKIFVTLFSETVRPIKLTLDTHVDNGWMYCVYRNQAAASYLSLISLSPVFKNFKFSSHFSQELWSQNSLNLVHLLTVGGCILYTRIRLLPLICPLISSFFFLSSYQTFTIFVSFFSGTVRPRKLKLGTHVDNGCMYRVYKN